MNWCHIDWIASYISDPFSNKLTFEFKNRLDLHCFDMYMNEYGHEMDGGYIIFNIHASKQKCFQTVKMPYSSCRRHFLSTQGHDWQRSSLIKLSHHWFFLQKDHIITDYQSHKVISYSQIGQNLHISPDPFEMDQDGLDAAFDSIVQVSHAWYLSQPSQPLVV